MGDKRELQLVLKLQDQASKELRKVSGELEAAEKHTSRWGETAKTLSKGLLAVGTAAAGFLGYGVKIAADLQTARMGLITLLGSAEEADKTIARLKKEAARTPFELPGLTQATQLLTSVTKDGNKSIDILLDVGEALAAMGKGQAELDRIIINLQQVAAVGKASLIDIRQFAFNGIPIFEMLTEQTGLAGESLATFIEDGGVTFELLTQMFDKANDAGGRFFNAFQNQTGTFNQAWANLKDSFGIFAADVATSTGLLGGLTNAMVVSGNALGNYRTHLETLRTQLAAFFQELEEKTGLVSLFREAWANIVFMYQTELKPALLDLWATLQPYKPFLEAMVKVFGTMLVIAIGAAILILGSLAIALTQVLTWITKIVDYILETFLGIWNNLTEAIAGTKGWVDALVDSLKTALSMLSKVANAIPAVKTAKSVIGGVGKILGVNDAIIAPNGNIITTHPDDYLIATKNPGGLGGGMNITITGNTFMSDREAAEKIGDMIIGTLGLNRKFT